MYSPFPELFTYILVAPLLLRVVVGLLFLAWGIRLFLRERYARAASELRVRWGGMGALFIWYLALFELVAGAMLVLGFYTQIAALMGILLVGKLYFYRNTFPTIAGADRVTYVLIFVICLSLLFTGAGAFGMDFPRL